MEQTSNTPRVVSRYDCRLGDLDQPGVRLIGVCRRCGHRSYLDVIWLLGRLPAYSRIDDVERKLKCSSCGGRSCAARIDWGPGVATS